MIVPESGCVPVSIVIPTYCRERVLVETIHYLLPLLGPGDELIVLDQTPAHEAATESALASWHEAGRIRWQRLLEPSIPQAMSRGLLEARNEFVVSQRVTIRANVLIAPGCFITDHAHLHRAGATIASQGCEGAAVMIGDDVWLGAHSIVLAGVTIGPGAIVAANSVVTGNVDPMTIVAGSPARVVGIRS